MGKVASVCIECGSFLVLEKRKVLFTQGDNWRRQSWILEAVSASQVLEKIEVKVPDVQLLSQVPGTCGCVCVNPGILLQFSQGNPASGLLPDLDSAGMQAE